MTLNLPKNPTPEQRKAVALALIRDVFEDNAENVRDIEPFEEDGWQTQYDAGGVTFNITYDGKTLEKWPVGGGQDD